MNLQQLKNKDFSFVYISREECSVCHALHPKIKKLSEKYRKASFQKIDLDEFPQAAGEFMVFSIPALIVYSRGKELYRGARFFNLSELEIQLYRYYNSIFY
ncbi:thioredoxin family protein [uncultured Ilyobacter sp.]|uniref:thioredoxin family protein n=1 Tax=uncultured Ilyobacter sp. TaxID=544433 RepID=UPI0029C0E868|nr:thioredoxin family protein [uncultured Ilyobacter sp.]